MIMFNTLITVDNSDDGMIYIYENDQWAKMNVMKRARTNFMTITYGTDVMIIGGKTFLNREKVRQP